MLRNASQPDDTHFWATMTVVHRTILHRSLESSTKLEVRAPAGAAASIAHHLFHGDREVTLSS
jgi:hypothetical protein